MSQPTNPNHNAREPNTNYPVFPAFKIPNSLPHFKTSNACLKKLVVSPVCRSPVVSRQGHTHKIKLYPNQPHDDVVQVKGGLICVYWVQDRSIIKYSGIDTVGIEHTPNILRRILDCALFC
jgi:hypothetical protein